MSGKNGYGMKRSKIGLIGGEEMGKIKRSSKLGLRKYLLMLVSSFPVLSYPIRSVDFWGKKSDVDHDPRKVAREARTRRISENEKKRQQNIARAGPRQERKMEIEKTLATTKISTASMGKFDKRLDGEKKIRGVKRKVERHFTFFE
jgi:hypothetical protein